MTPPNSAQICIVIPFYRGEAQLNRCLMHLADNSFKDFKVIIVDHRPAGSPGINTIPQKIQERVSLVRGNDTLWWSGAINLGLETALDLNYQFIMLLNHDCYLEQNALEVLMDISHLNPRAVIAPAQADWDSRITTIIRAYTCYLLGFPTLIPPPSWSRSNAHGSVFRTGMIVGGRGVLIPRTILKDVGLLDAEQLPHYGSDNDFFMRCKQKGYRLLVTAQTRAYIDKEHTTLADYGGNSGFRGFLDSLRNIRSHRNIKDQMALFRKHYPIPGLYPVGVLLNIARYTLMTLFHRLATVGSGRK